jgi:membrane-associated phospholipid phosphatase
MKARGALKKLINKYRHGWVLSYFFIYMAWFTYLERHNTNVTPIYSKLDDYIPFLEIFIIPYLLWFIYIAVTVIYFLLTSKQDFYKICAYLFIGMSICLAIYTVWPNGHNLRVNLGELGRSNIFTRMLSFIYGLDTSTNVFPSIHVYNSIGAAIAIRRDARLSGIKWLQWSVFSLTVLICASTVFLKQHSILDIFGAIALNIIMYAFVYVPVWGRAEKTEKQVII